VEIDECSILVERHCSYFELIGPRHCGRP